MKPVSLFDLGIYSTTWIKDFYTQAFDSVQHIAFGL